MSNEFIEEDFWQNNEPAMKNGKKNLLRFFIIKILTILFIGYIAYGYSSDVKYFFSNNKPIKLKKVTIDTIDKIDTKEWKKYHNQYGSISGWVELENSFAVKIGFSKYDILKLWRKPIFVAIKQGDPGLTKSQVKAAIPFIDIKGRVYNYYKLAKRSVLFNPYLSLGKGYHSTSKKIMDKNAIIIMAHEKPKADYWSLIIVTLLLLYILYSLYSLIKLIKLVNFKEE